MDPAVHEQPALLNNFAPPNNFPNANLPAMINWNPPVNQVIPPMNMPLPNAQNNFDPDAIGTLEEMFPRIDIRKVLQIYHGQFNLERVAQFIINNEQTMPKKTGLGSPFTT
uniref:CUE domain-containing protein n=1 Tax=Panagrolaimus sp. JU765 TaxID=591449 RepID=A0AC34RS96_9BILA